VTPGGEILVAGGTGTLGRAVVRRLAQRGIHPRVLSRRPGEGRFVGDLLTEVGVDDALSGASTVINCATSPGHDEQAAERLLDAARRHGVDHLVHVSIVGIDRVPLPYYREKLAVESMIRATNLPATVLRATQFHDLLATIFAKIARAGAIPVPARSPFQPVDVTEVADHLVGLALAPPAGRVPDFAGPQIADAASLARIWLRAGGRHRPVVPLPIPGRVAAAVRAGGLLPSGSTRGTLTFRDYLTRPR
jgi:uncharacterized protein YbjT (DUF2867 family)